MAEQLSNQLAISVGETDSPFYFEGGTFTLGAGPFTVQTFSAQDDEDDFSSISPEPTETQGEGRQTAQLCDENGDVRADGIASLEQVITLTDPNTGATILVGRVRLSEDDNSFGNGAELGEVYIFDGPIDPNVTYTVTAINYSPGDGAANSYTYDTFTGGSLTNGGVVCFAAGTQIRTAKGTCPVEEVRVGSLVQTVDNGLQRVLWAGSVRIERAELLRHPELRPVRIEAGALGNVRPLIVSQQHRIAVRGQLVKAKHLPIIPGLRARVANGIKAVGYHHVLLADHHMLIANGVEAESLFLGEESLRILNRFRSLPESSAGFYRNAIRHRLPVPAAA